MLVPSERPDEIPSHGKFLAFKKPGHLCHFIIGRSYYPPTGLSNIITISSHSRLFNGFATGRFLIKYSAINHSGFHIIIRFLFIRLKILKYENIGHVKKWCTEGKDSAA